MTRHSRRLRKSVNQLLPDNPSGDRFRLLSLDIVVSCFKEPNFLAPTKMSLPEAVLASYAKAPRTADAFGYAVYTKVYLAMFFARTVRRKGRFAETATARRCDKAGYATGHETPMRAERLLDLVSSTVAAVYGQGGDKQRPCPLSCPCSLDRLFAQAKAAWLRAHSALDPTRRRRSLTEQTPCSDNQPNGRTTGSRPPAQAGAMAIDVRHSPQGRATNRKGRGNVRSGKSEI